MSTPPNASERLTNAIAQLRHAYWNLKRPDDGNWTPLTRAEFADGLIAPQIRALETLQQDITEYDSTIDAFCGRGTP